jgi:hypothetical protein
MLFYYFVAIFWPAFIDHSVLCIFYVRVFCQSRSKRDQNGLPEIVKISVCDDYKGFIAPNLFLKHILIIFSREWRQSIFGFLMA